VKYFPLVHPDSESGELVLPVSHAEAGDGPAPSQVVERGELLSHPDRVAKRQDEHVRPEPHVPRVRRERGKKWQWLQGRHVAQVVLQHPDRIDAGLRGRSYLLTQLHDPVGRHGARRKVVHDGQTELHDAPPGAAIHAIHSYEFRVEYRVWTKLARPTLTR
jgi:hypothetical protein